MTEYSATKFTRRILVISGIAASIGCASPALASRCFLDNNNDGVFDATNDSPAGAEAPDANSTACGSTSKANGNVATAYGATSNASNSGTVAIGFGATASGVYAIAMGTSATASGLNSIALGGGGSSTIASGSNATAIGADGRAQGANSTAMGASARATLFQSTAYGYNSQATGADSFAAGAGARASNQGSLAFGGNSLASGQGSSAIGGGAIATGTNATAMGRGAAAQYDGSTAIGENAITFRARQVRLGGQSSSVNIGDIDASTSAQRGVTYYLTVDNDGTLGRGAHASGAVDLTGMQYDTALDDLKAGQAAIDDAVAAQGQQISQLFDLAAYDRRDSHRGTAAAMALTNAPFPEQAGQTGYAANTSLYRGQTAFSASLSHRFGDAPFAVNAGVSHAGGKNTGGRLGVAGIF